MSSNIIAFVLLTGFTVFGLVIIGDWIKRNARSAIGQNRRDQVSDCLGGETVRRTGGGEGPKQGRTGLGIQQISSVSHSEQGS